MITIPNETVQQLFTEARSFSAWLTQDVSHHTLHEIYNLMKWGPTSANSCPARIVFVRTEPEKEKLMACVAPGNVEKVKTAPVTAIIAQDEKFYEQIPKLFPHAPAFRDYFANDKTLAETTAFRNSSLQGAYFILAARALGLDCGPMSGFDNKKVDDTFFSRTSWKSNFLCSIGYGDRAKLFPRSPRLAFEEACKII